MKKDKISLYEFLALPDQEQFAIIFNKGNYIDFRLEEKKRFVLYAVELFFVEVEYDNEANKVINKRAFVSGEILDKYSGLN